MFRKSKPSASMVVAVIALVFALGGVSVAASGLTDGAMIKPGTVHHLQLGKHSVGTSNLTRNSIGLNNLTRSLRTQVNRRTRVTLPGQSGIPGSSGATGSQGSQGSQGAKGDPGANGDTGAKGTSSPNVFGSYPTTNDPDSGVNTTTNGGNWAVDAFGRTYTVTPMPDGSFNVTENFLGSFVTLAGNSPQDNTKQIPAGITGTMYGDEAFAVPPGADYNPTAKCLPTTDTTTGKNDACNATSFFKAYFNLDSSTLKYAWEFYYSTPAGSHWANTDHGTSGNITN